MEHVKKVEESYIESDKMIDLQIEKVLIELSNDESPESDNDVTDSSSECRVNLISVLSMNIINYENKKGNKFCFKSLFCCPS